MLFDLAYYSIHLFDRPSLPSNTLSGGFFLSQLKANANPVIVDTHRDWRGRAIPVVGNFPGTGGEEGTHRSR